MSATLDETRLQELARRVRARQGLPSPDARRALRRAAGISLDDIAAVVGVTRQAVGLWEAGARTPQGPNLDSYAAVLETLRRACAGSPRVLRAPRNDGARL